MQKFQKLRLLLNRIQNKLLAEYRTLTKPSLVKLEGIAIRVDPYFSEPIRASIYRGHYEADEMKIVKSHLFPNDIVMEIGAGIGLISSYCAKKIGSERVFTYEANPELETHIRETYKLNSVFPTLEICLVGDRPGEETFYIEKNFWSSSITPWNQNARSVKVPVKSFNEEVRRINPSFLIMDVEGGEYDILKNADFYNIQKLAIELHEKLIGSEKVQFVKAKLDEAGFQVNKNFYGRQKVGLEQLFWERLK
ncbi:FkbM family methyltransferase [Argonema antarcticum]|uniref:FkbM family methyltransferase n=1 Tax=Argonema antarcticum TaxID=2942763 RepID=UPI0020137A25|nr:FkbM family methyltransferase [Argonema antarcticum]MCL1471483.1 FkbM family methyltransferase [Argonema antarcticum A004/B2]